MIDGVLSFTVTFIGSGAISSLQFSQLCTAVSKIFECYDSPRLRIANMFLTTPLQQSGGDPHFKRFQAPRRESFHGECDLVMLKAPLFDLHIRTTIAQHYSFIELAAVKMKERILEISTGNPSSVLLDGKVHSMDGFEPLIFSSFHKNTTYKYYNADTSRSSKTKTYILEITPWVFIRVKMHAEFLTVSVHGDDDLDGAVGLLGRYPDGALVTRSGEVVSVPFAEFAAEWQVNPDDGVLFQEPRTPQLPYERCRMPTISRPSRRMLRASSDGLYQKALEACRKVDYFADDIDLCIDDILATGDVGLATIW